MSAERQGRLLRASRPSRRLPLAAVRGAPRRLADAAVPHRARAPRSRRGAPGHRVTATATRPMASRRWSRPGRNEDSNARKLLIGADGLHSAVRARCTPTSRRSSGAARSCGGARPRGADPQRRIVRRLGRTATASCSIRSRRPIPRPVSPRSTGSPRSPSTTRGLEPRRLEREVAIDSFIHHFEGWRYDWLDVPAMLRGAEEVFEYPMIDRDPVPTWVDGRVALLGTRRTSCTRRARTARAKLSSTRVCSARRWSSTASRAEALRVRPKLCAESRRVVLRNRGRRAVRLAEPLDERCGGVFDDIDDVIPARSARVHGRYKSAAGFASETLNAAPSMIARGAKVEAA